MRRKFYKMHGIGNDYVFFNCMHRDIPYPAELAIRLSDRNFSIGGDGVILICKSAVADAKMRIFNADGSEGKTCGNGLRCTAKLLYELGIIRRKELTVETLGGVARLWIYTGTGGAVKRVKADVGRADFTPAHIPVLAERPVIGKKLTIGGRTYTSTCVSVGNPHCVIFSEPPADLAKAGKAFKESELFPEGVNVEFAEVISPQEVRVRVWERGSGETLACGSGACAVVAAAVVNGYCREGEDVFVRLRGGSLTVNYTKERILMTGAACLAYTGFVEI